MYTQVLTLTLLVFVGVNVYGIMPYTLLADIPIPCFLKKNYTN